jgi:hypothetical protein
MAGLNAAAGLRAGACAVAVGLAAGMVAVACEGSTAPGTRAAPRVTATTTAITTGQSRPYALYTHCGVSEARFAGRYYKADHPLSDGAGNPPAGWGNPYQAGTMTMVSATKAVFTDKAGHRVVFDLRPGATGFLTMCS